MGDDAGFEEIITLGRNRGRKEREEMTGWCLLISWTIHNATRSDCDGHDEAHCWSSTGKKSIAKFGTYWANIETSGDMAYLMSLYVYVLCTSICITSAFEHRASRNEFKIQFGRLPPKHHSSRDSTDS